jgi:hypothetical protein
MKIILRYPRSCGWVLFFGGYGALIACDYRLRMRDGEISGGGVPEMLWFAVQWVLAAGAAWLVWCGARQWKRRWVSIGELSAHAGAGFLVYLWIGLWYVTGTGIDSL